MTTAAAGLRRQVHLIYGAVKSGAPFNADTAMAELTFEDGTCPPSSHDWTIRPPEPSGLLASRSSFAVASSVPDTRHPGNVSMSVLDLSPLESALDALDRGLARAIPAPLDEELRDACIQRFEFSFELAWKMLKRRLELDLPSPATIDGMSFRELFRVGAEQGLIADPAVWFVYRDKRNITSDTSSAAKAAEVFAAIPQFAKDAKQLLARLKARGNEDA